MEVLHGHLAGPGGDPIHLALGQLDRPGRGPGRTLAARLAAASTYT
jgi:hypothetical protein